MKNNNISPLLLSVLLDLQSNIIHQSYIITFGVDATKVFWGEDVKNNFDKLMNNVNEIMENTDEFK